MHKQQDGRLQRRSHKGYLIIALLGLAAMLLPPVAQGAEGGDRLASVLPEIQDMVANAPGNMGLVVAVTDRDKLRLVAAHGYADFKTRQQVSADTLFAIGSISKSFTSIILMQLWDEGRFDPDLPFSRYLPDFRPGTKFAPITGAALMTHSSGLPNYRSDTASMRYLTVALNGYQPLYAPGAHYWYSNSAYQLLGYGVERIEGAAFPSILQRRVLDRLGMRDSWPQTDQRFQGRIPTSYVRSPADGQWVEAPWVDYLASDGAILSNGRDMAAYARMLLNGGESAGESIMSRQAFVRFTTPALNDYAFGLFSKNGGKTLSHSGSIAGFNAYLEVRADKDFGVVFLSNGRLDMAFVRGIVDKLAGQLGQPGGGDSEDDAVTEAGSAQDYAGDYLGANGEELSFAPDAQGGLALTGKGGTTPLDSIGRDSFAQFISENGPCSFLFFRNGQTHRVEGVSTGTDWFIRKTVARKGAALPLRTPAAWRAFAGRYKAHGEEGPDLRIFVRDGKLFMTSAQSRSEATALEEIEPGLFRLAEPDYAPERFRFDTIIDGHAQRLEQTGQSLYRIELP